MLNNRNNILISVLLPVYNGGSYLEESIRSILNQTQSCFEMIIVNDGSTDDSSTILEKFRNDKRIRIFNQQNIGLASTLNRAIGLSTGKYLARQDQDDLSLPLRFEKQVKFLENSPKYGMVGTWAEIISEKPFPIRYHKHPIKSPVLKFDLLFNNPFVHSSVMIRRGVLDQVGLYSTDRLRQPPEDYELWSRIARDFEVANIPEVLVKYREVSGSMSRDKFNPFLERLVRISSENLSWYSGRKNSDKDCYQLAALTHGLDPQILNNSHLKEFTELLNSATKRISTSCGFDERILKKRAENHLRSIRRSYFQNKYGRTMGLALDFLESMKMVIR